MVLTIADASPANHTHEGQKAPGGKSSAIFALKCVAPPQISHSIVPTTPIHSSTEIFPIVAIRRYSKITMRTTNPPQIPFPPHPLKPQQDPPYFPTPIHSQSTHTRPRTTA